MSDTQAGNEIKELEKNRDTVQRRLKDCTDQFFIYGYVKQIEEIDDKILKLKTNTHVKE